jgi:hypothetical protein
VSNGDLDLASQEFRPVAERMAAAPLDRRQAILGDWLHDRPDADAFRQAVAIVDPETPPPADDIARPAAGPTVKMTCAADIEPKKVEWLWRNRVPLGMLTTFAGDPKLGKSFVTVAMASAVSRGDPLPEGDIPERPGSVILLSAEDDPARTIVPRLRAAGADLSRIHILESIIQPGLESDDRREALPPVERMPSLLDYDLAVIEAKAARLPDCRLIVVDPVSAYLGGKDDHRNAELRSVLSPLKAMAERLNVAIVLVTHCSKSGGVDGKRRVIGSIAYVGASRANYLFLKDKDDPTGRRVLLLDNGGNLAPTQPGLAYVIEDRGDGPAVEWLAEPVHKDADTALRELAEAQAQTGRPEQAAERRDCGAWLRQDLSQGRQPAIDCERDGRTAGFTRATLNRAKQDIGAVSKREGFGKDSKCYWAMPDASIDDRDEVIDSSMPHRFQEDQPWDQ